MTKYLWSKPSSGESSTGVQEFLSGEDVVLDRALFHYDVLGTKAHARGLARIKILDQAELQAIEDSLAKLLQAFEEGTFVLGPPFEDSHSAIESWLTEQLGEIGQKVHTGRSRNDQVQLAMRLYLRDRLDQLAQLCLDLSEVCLDRAAAEALTPIPGYTHLQRAVPSSIGLWMGGFAESFMDIGQLTWRTRQWLNTCPLGTAAGYGVNLPLDRSFLAEELGFDRVQVNPLYVQNSRGRFELQAVGCLSQATLELRRLSWDLSLYTTQEFGFVSLSDEFVTGSSIMPNKSNPDTVEILRASHAIIEGATVELQSILGLPSAYHRDLQLSKPPTLRAFAAGLAALRIAGRVVEKMEFHHERMRAAIDGDMYATDVAIDRVIEQGIPFRQAYRDPISQDEIKDRTPEKSLAARVSLGSCADLQLEQLAQRLTLIREQLAGDHLSGLD